jgi:hypothetical protein
MENPILHQGMRTRSALRAVVLYSEIESGLRARTLLQRASRRAGWAGAMENSFWRFDVMAKPAVAREALYGAVDADMVLLVAKGMSDPPEWLLEWLEIWALSRRIQDAILAAWCEEHLPQRPNRGIANLRKLAQRHGLVFLCADEARAQAASIKEAAPESCAGSRQ